MVIVMIKTKTRHRGSLENDHERVRLPDQIWTMIWTTRPPPSPPVPHDYLTPAHPLPLGVEEVVLHPADVHHQHGESSVHRPLHPPYIIPVRLDHGVLTRMRGRPLDPRGKRTLLIRISPFWVEQGMTMVLLSKDRVQSSPRVDDENDPLHLP